jgi:hypothetical protein
MIEIFLGHFYVELVYFNLLNWNIVLHFMDSQYVEMLRKAGHTNSYSLITNLELFHNEFGFSESK